MIDGKIDFFSPFRLLTKSVSPTGWENLASTDENQKQMNRNVALRIL